MVMRGNVLPGILILRVLNAGSFKVLKVTSSTVTIRFTLALMGRKCMRMIVPCKIEISFLLYV